MAGNPDRNSGDGPELRRALGFWALVAFGVGDILGAGIYALVGEIAAIAGHASWVAFGVALFAAGLTALSYAELGGRFPNSGGEARFCQTGFGSAALALMIGWLVLCSGVVSMATVARAFAGYLLETLAIHSAMATSITAALFLVSIALVNCWGIRQTSTVNIAFTLVEASGLGIVLVTGLHFLLGPAGQAQAPPPGTTEVFHTMGGAAILQAAALAFFAFIGFEDMVNVAEEVKHPRRTLPRAILVAVAFAGILYMLVIAVAVRVVPPAELGQSQAPMLEVVTRAAPSIPPLLFTLIALFAVANTGLLNLVTASRLLYGMAGQDLIPAWFRRLHPATLTPHRATAAILVVAVILTVSGTLPFLAGTTSVLILAVFLAVNGALLCLRTFRRDQLGKWRGFQVPLILPLVALLSCLALMAFAPAGSLLRASILVGVGFGLMVWRSGRAAR